MFPKAIAASLQLPKLDTNSFTATKFHSPGDKAKFGNHLLRFIAEDFPAALWTKSFYERLSNSFSNIAHHNAHGFWVEWFEFNRDKLGFLENIATHHCWGNPEFTFSDVEKVVRARVTNSGIIDWSRTMLAQADRAADLRQLARLKAIYEPVTAEAATEQVSYPTTSAMTQTELFAK